MTDYLRSMERNYKKTGAAERDEIKYYDERLSKRRERERQEKKMNDFLHNSLRASDRLRALERTNKTSDARINPAFEEEQATIDEITDFNVVKLIEAVCNRRNIRGVLNRSDLDWIQYHIKSNTFQNSYETNFKLGKILTRYNYPLVNTHSRSERTSNECLEHLKHARGSGAFNYQIMELKQLLQDPYIVSLLQTNDLCSELSKDAARLRRDQNKLMPSLPGYSVDNQNGTPITPPTQPHSTKKTSPIKSRVDEQKPQPTSRTNHNQTPTNIEMRNQVSHSSGRFIRSPLPGCYAQIYQTESGIPLKTVVLEKDDTPLGATVRNERESVVVGRIVVGGVAQKSGLLREGDELLAVNGIDLTAKDVNEVSDILSRMTGTLKFTVAAADDGTISTINQRQTNTTMLDFRALFTYNPDDDAYIPCKDIGLRFERGDILHVTNTSDPNWWQAYRDESGCKNGALGELAGLIPSAEYQYNREMLRKQLGLDESSSDIYPTNGTDSSMICVKKGKKQQPATVNGWIYNVDSQQMSSMNDGANKRKNRKSKRSTYYPGDFEANFQDPNIITYEEVELFLPQPHRKRPIVLVGPELIGRHEIVRKIVDKDHNTFAFIKQHTTCSTASRDYQVVPKETFKFMQNQEDFIETGIFEKNLYGTSKSEIKKIIDCGKTAVLVLQPESLRAIRKTSFLPYIIFMSPPTRINDLRTLRMELDKTRPADQELNMTINRAKLIDMKYGHMFDAVIEVKSIDSALETALRLISRLERDPQWVPCGWATQRIN